MGHLALWFVVFNLSLTDLAQASPELNLFGYDTQSMSLTRLRNEVNGRTSIELSQEILSSNDLEKQMRDQGGFGLVALRKYWMQMVRSQKV